MLFLNSRGEGSNDYGFNFLVCLASFRGTSRGSEVLRSIMILSSFGDFRITSLVGECFPKGYFGILTYFIALLLPLLNIVLLFRRDPNGFKSSVSLKLESVVPPITELFPLRSIIFMS